MADKAPNQNVSMVRNIIVGVSTSVIGAASLYFLGINKSGSSASSQGTFLEVKEATTKGWKSYMANANIYYKNSKTITAELGQDNNFGNFKTAALREMHKFQDDLETLLKDNSLDNTFVSMIKRRLELLKESEEKLSTHIDNLKNFSEDNSLTAAVKQQKLQDEVAKLSNSSRGISERSLTESEGFAKALNDKYGQLFDLNDLLSYKELKNGTYSANANSSQVPKDLNNAKSNIPAAPANTTIPPNTSTASNGNGKPSAGWMGGNWSNEGGVLHLDDNGFSWRWNDGSPTSTGYWRVLNNQLMFEVHAGASANTTQVFNFLETNGSSSFTIQWSSNPSVVYHCIKQ